MSRFTTTALLFLLTSCTGLEPYQERRIPGDDVRPSDDPRDTSDPVTPTDDTADPQTQPPSDATPTPGGSTPTPEPTPPPVPSGPPIGTPCTLEGVSSAIYDCSGSCVDSSGLNNGECDDGTPDPSGLPTADFDCANFSNDFGDCVGSTTPPPGAPVPGEACNGAGLVDCDGVCINSNLLGDGVCHDGNGGDLMCAENNFDNGDCDNVTTPIPPSTGNQPEICFFDDGTQGVLDCDRDYCVLPSIVGDGDCDDGGFLFWDAPDMDCALFNDDGGDC